VGGGDEGGVVMPAEPGTAFEVVQAESGFEFAVVVLDAPPHFGQAHELSVRGVGGQATFGCSGDVAVGWAYPQGQKL